MTTNSYNCCLADCSTGRCICKSRNLNHSTHMYSGDTDVVEASPSTDEITPYENNSRSLYNSVTSWCKWNNTSLTMLAKAETKLLSSLRNVYDGLYVPIGPDSRLWTLIFNKQSQKTPIVFVHGMGAGVALWINNFDDMADKRPTYAFDVLGFGRSSRVVFSTDPSEAEDEFVHSIEKWRSNVKIDKFILLGHSLGGYLAFSYALKHPEQIKHLILVDPWGFPEKPSDVHRTIRLPLWARMIGSLMSNFNPLFGVRLAGPWGTKLIRRLRPDLGYKFSNPEDFYNYIYHCNAQTPSGETAFRTLNDYFGWSKNPMLHRVGELHPSINITCIYGARSWVDHNSGFVLKAIRNNMNSSISSTKGTCDVHVINGAGHHVYADKATEFNQLVNDICSKVDKQPSLRLVQSEYKFQTYEDEQE